MHVHAQLPNTFSVIKQWYNDMIWLRELLYSLHISINIIIYREEDKIIKEYVSC